MKWPSFVQLPDVNWSKADINGPSDQNNTVCVYFLFNKLLLLTVLLTITYLTIPGQYK